MGVFLCETRFGAQVAAGKHVRHTVGRDDVLLALPKAKAKTKTNTNKQKKKATTTTTTTQTDKKHTQRCTNEKWNGGQQEKDKEHERHGVRKHTYNARTRTHLATANATDNGGHAK